MQTIIFIVAFFALGYGLRKLIAEPNKAVKWLNNYIIYVAMPSIILVKIPAMSFGTEMLIPAGFAWGWALVGGLTVLGVSRALRFPRPLEGAALLLAILGNTSFLGYPMVQAFFDDRVLSYAIVFDQLGNFLMLSTAGLVIIAVYAPRESGLTLSAATIAKRVFSFPPFIALIIAALLPVDSVANAVEPILLLLGKTLMPLALIVIGLQFQPQLLPEHRKPLVTAIVAKMLLSPVLAYAILIDSRAEVAIIQATIFEAAMPCMITPGIIAIQAGLSPRFCATLLGYSTLFSFAWLPVVASVIS